MSASGRDAGEKRAGGRLLGMLLVTSAALMFGLVAACIKGIQLPTLLLQQCRSTIEWMVGVLVALFSIRYQRAKAARQPLEEELLSGEAQEPVVLLSLTETLFGQAEFRKWIVLRAFLYWCFLFGWWSALKLMPLGDATAIVYVGPLFTALFGYLFLGESIDWTFYPIATFSMAGVACISQPTFIFGAAEGTTGAPSGVAGPLVALAAAIVAGLLPVCTRKSKSCPWIAINHCSSLLSMVCFTPLAIFIWTQVEPSAGSALSEGVGQLMGSSQDSGAVGMHEWSLLLGATLLGYIGLAQQTIGYQLEQASRASIMTVLEIPFSYALQVIFFGQGISHLAMIGSGLIVLGTLLNVIRRIQLG